MNGMIKTVFLGIAGAAVCLGMLSVPARAEIYEVGDEVTFGQYWQEKDSDEKQPIAWKVLAVQDDELLLISRDCLACFPYNSELEDVTWEDCSLRGWLNSQFLIDAFDQDEQDQLLEKSHETEDNTHYETYGGEETEDRVFILSQEEAEEYFENRENRTAEASEWTGKEPRDADDEDEDDGDEEDGDEDDGDEEDGDEDDREEDGSSGDEDSPGAEGQRPKLLAYVSGVSGNCFWWLRTPGETPKDAECVGAEGSFLLSGYKVTQSDVGVRPAVWVRVD